MIPCGQCHPIPSHYHPANVIVYNANNVSGERYQEIDAKFPTNDIVILIGTSQAAHQTHECNGTRMKFHDWRDFGYKRFGRKGNHGHEDLGNKSCGVSIGFKNKTINTRNIHHILTPPQELQGRMGGIRIKHSHYDIAPIAVYFPPKVHTIALRPKYIATVDKICKSSING